MNENRPSLADIYGKTQASMGAAPQAPTGTRPSLSDIYSGKKTNQTVQPVQNNKETLFRSANGNYLDNLIPDGALQTGANFIGDIAGSAVQPFYKLKNTILDATNRGVESLTGKPTPDFMRIDPDSKLGTNQITGENAMPVYQDKQGQTLTPGATALNALGTIGEGALNVALPGSGKVVDTLAVEGLVPALIQGFKSGTKLSAGYGAAAGAQEFTDASDVGQYGNMAVQTGLYGIGGGILGIFGGLLSGAAKAPLRKAFENDIKSGLSMESSPAIKEVATKLGLNTPEAVAKARQDSIDQIYNEITQSTRNPIQNIDAQMVSDPQYKDDVLGTLIDNLSIGDTFGKNRVNWSNTTKALTDRETAFNSALADIQQLEQAGNKVNTGLSSKSLENYVRDAAMSVTRDEDVINDIVTKAASKIQQKSKTGNITLDGLNALRDISNELYQAGDKTGNAMSLAIKKYTQDVLGNPKAFGVSDKVAQAINDNDLIWNELRKIKTTKSFLKKWAPETLLKDTGFARQLAGATGFGMTNGNFFGYLGAQAVADKILTSTAKMKMMKLYGNPFSKMEADKIGGELRTGLMDNIKSIGKDEMYKLQATQKKNIIKDLAKIKEKKITDAKYSPPNQELYTPYTPESKLPVIDAGKTPKPKKATEPYFDITTGKMVDPRVLGAAGLAVAATGGEQASAMQQGTPAQAPRFADNPLKLTPEQIENVKQAIAGKETGGEKDPYTATNTKQSAHGVDRGRFQFSDSLRKELTQLYFGKIISPKDFTPAVQEELMTRHIQSLLDNGFSVGQIFRIHRKGLQGMMSDTAMDYGETVLKKYNALEEKRKAAESKKQVDNGTALKITPGLKKILNMK
jgi:hypothetical protein